MLGVKIQLLGSQNSHMGSFSNQLCGGDELEMLLCVYSFSTLHPLGEINRLPGPIEALRGDEPGRVVTRLQLCSETHGGGRSLPLPELSVWMIHR